MVPERVIEVRCERCQASFAPETRRCIHCGGRLTPAGVLGRTPSPARKSPMRAAPSAWPAPEEAAGAGPGDEEAEVELPSPARNVIWVVTAILAILGSILGRC